MMLKRLLHPCKVPLDLMDYDDVWVCEICRSRWRCKQGRWVGSKYPERLTFFQWLLGLDGSD